MCIKEAGMQCMFTVMKKILYLTFHSMMNRGCTSIRFSTSFRCHPKIHTKGSCMSNY